MPKKTKKKKKTRKNQTCLEQAFPFFLFYACVFKVLYLGESI